LASKNGRAGKGHPEVAACPKAGFGRRLSRYGTASTAASEGGWPTGLFVPADGLSRSVAGCIKSAIDGGAPERRGSGFGF
jgi:hypothetical protein